MNQVFKALRYMAVPDGTKVSPFLNATDSTQENLPVGKLGDMSLASGQIAPGVLSWIHHLPLVAQSIYVVEGCLTVVIQELHGQEPYSLTLKPSEAALCKRGSFLQLRNESEKMTTVLYMVSPSYVFNKEGDEVMYDDSVLVAKTWEECQNKRHVYFEEQWILNKEKQRKEALRRLAIKKGGFFGTKPWKRATAP